MTARLRPGPRLRALALAASLAASLARCAGAVRPPAPIPRGDGWHCFEPHPSGSLAPSCYRSHVDCVRGLADAVRRSRGDLEPVAYSNCAGSPDAACVLHRSPPLNPRTTGYVCMARTEHCEAERNEIHAEATVTGSCARYR